MSEPTLALARGDLQARLGTFAGWGRGANFNDQAWSAYQQAVIDDATDSGLRRFYYPTAVEGQAEPYEWSFLRPTASLDLPVGKQQIQLPDDYAGFDGEVTILTTGTTAQPWKIEWTTAPRLRQMFSISPSITGPPMYVAEDAQKGTRADAGQRYNLLIFPASDQEYTLQVNYFVNPDTTLTTNPYPYGGAEHAETILESCLAVMEERLDDMSATHANAFNKRLQASIAMDRKKKPIKFGPNLDRSDWPGWTRRDIHYAAPAASYNGNPFN